MNITTFKQELLVHVGQVALSGLYAAPAEGTPRALIVAFHGGGASAGIFDVSVGGEASYIDTAASLGYLMIALNRPGYGASAEIEAASTTFDAQVDILIPALERIWEQYGTGSSGLYLVGHSIGGMIALSIAARNSQLPLIGVSTHSAGLIWQTGIPEMLRSLITDASHVVFPSEGRFGAYGPEWSWTAMADEQLQKCSTPLPVKELQDALVWPERLRQISAFVQIPVQVTITEFDNFWSSSPEVLDELKHFFPAAPFVNVYRQRFSGHNPSSNLAARAFNLRDLAFAEECRVQAMTAAAQREEKAPGN